MIAALTIDDWAHARYAARRAERSDILNPGNPRSSILNQSSMTRSQVIDAG
jgi:hypothetical protein